MLPFVCVSLGLLRHNWYPACTYCLRGSHSPIRATILSTHINSPHWLYQSLLFFVFFFTFPAVFVGDTFCYFSGMTFAVVGILGHFSKTLLLFFIPQIINFLWSCPQLFKFVPCPRHRLPRLDAQTGLLQASTFPCRSDQYRWLKRKPDDTECPNMTVICLCLQILGPMKERDLCVVLLTLQAFSCAFGLFCRYYLAKFFFEG